MITLLGKRFDPDNLEVIYQADFSPEGFEKEFEVKAGEWKVEDGWLIGKNPNNAPGMVVSKNNFYGNVMLDFEAQTILPSTHDIDVMWHGSWDEEKNERSTAYVAGLEGWYDGKAGFEKAPDNGFTVITPLLDFNPGDLYHVQVGSIDGHLFLIVDGRLVLEVTDPQPIDHSKLGMIGFEAFASHIKIKNLKVKEIAFEEIEQEYAPEF